MSRMSGCGASPTRYTIRHRGPAPGPRPRAGRWLAPEQILGPVVSVEQIRRPPTRRERTSRHDRAQLRLEREPTDVPPRDVLEPGVERAQL